MISLKTAIFNPFEHNLDKELFLPVIKNAVGYDCMIGYFNSSSFRAIARSLLYYLQSDVNHQMRLIVSPNLSKEDINTLINLYEGNVYHEDITEFILNQDNLSQSTFHALAYLIKLDKIQLKIALPESGLFHVKCWLIPQSDGSEIIVQGSSNHTESGLVRNFEYLSVDSTLKSKQSLHICQKLRQDFDLLWENNYPNITCGNLSLDVLRALLLQFSSTQVSAKYTIQHLTNALRQALKQQQESECMQTEDYTSNLKSLLSDYRPDTLSTPAWLDYRTGDYAHQGEAIDAWFANDNKGILSIATGGGKTLTSLTTATLLSKSLKNLLVVIAVPTKALMAQWESEVALFGSKAVNLNNINGSKNKLSTIDRTCKNLKFNSSHVEVLIISHNALKSELMSKIEKYSSSFSTLLIADEVHNLGSTGFIENPPDFFDFKIGLSATPIRQYDEEGSEFLLQYFGDVVYDFPLDKAIGKCLVPFDYYAHIINLTAEEEDNFYELTQKIRRLSFAVNASKDSIEFQNWSRLCIKRRKIIETAENKIFSFERCLPSKGSDITNTLVFCSDKQPEQLELINDILNKKHVNFHQITSHETANNTTLKQIIDEYNQGRIQVLTSKRVLDEGFNVPQTQTAYILASNTTKKQWTQRLGRVLRKDKGKSEASIHDFIVMPSISNAVMDDDFKNLLKSEATRIQFFLQFSKNGTEQNGAVELLGKIGDLLQGKRR
ncbi:DEAD/DEAH box helicase family protein [Psychrobacter sp. K31L]|uniref:DEAD/DEAH box helicase family protein n=1 Tax=Psychrobacter sp. K31L TaxID=2820758 RepID=UPI001B32BED9|nr:DEAD/DEAH box helicase family protein [Psychrobacter sp. K31L]MBP3945936.1 DEAD/DEAH box helicase family protein [Psychrobacter sp. K31L]